MIWHSSTAEETAKELSTSLNEGLTDLEAQNALAEHGPNRLAEAKKQSFLSKFIAQLKDFMVIILIIAAVISCATNIISGDNEWIEPVVIIAIVIANALMGVIQESKAEAALEALKNLTPPKAAVIRNGRHETIDASTLVPGDIILLESGDYIPADARLIETASLACDESALTGESVAAEKDATAVLPDITALGDRKNMVYSGCSVAYGRGKAIVTETGMNTEMGKIATILESTELTTTPLQERLTQLGKTLGIMALAICGVIFIYGMIFSPLDLYDRFLNMFMTSVSLAVAAIPEGLAAIVTVVLAIGVQRMVSKNAIIRRLPAVETLGSTSVICSDKTGTLTQNRMTLVSVYNTKQTVDLTAENDVTPDIQNILRMGAMCCDGTVEVIDGREKLVGDPTETAIVSAAMHFAGDDKATIDSVYPRLCEIPFDSDRKLMTTVNMIDNRPVAVVKGAPDKLLPLCTHGDIEAAMKANDEMAAKALRVLAIAFKPLDEIPSNPTSSELENGLVLAGLVGMIDPPRNEAKEAIRLCKKAGIKTVMITGDHILTAKAIAEQLGILGKNDRAITGAELKEMSDEELLANVQHIAVYARVTPDDKIRIVKAWQQTDAIVAMTGDGVNDAPALRAADIGCAMGITGTDVAKGAADMTLTDDNFATIVSAVREGRGIYNNIRKSIQYLLSCNLGEVITIFAAMIIWTDSPLLAIQLLLINLVTDGLPALALGVEPVTSEVMEVAPRKKKESIFAHGLGINSAWQGVMFAVITVGAYALGRDFFGASMDAESAKALGDTMAFAVLGFSELMHVFNMRSNRSLFTLNPFSNKWVWGAVALSAGIMVAVLTVPALQDVFATTSMNGSQWLCVIGLSIVPIIVTEIQKLITFLLEKKKGEKIVY